MATPAAATSFCSESRTIEEFRLHPLDKALIGLEIGVHIDREDDQPSVRIGDLKLAEDGERRLARRAPGGPEIDQDDLSLQIREITGQRK